MKRILIENAKTAPEKFLMALWGDYDFMSGLYDMSHVKFFLGTIYPILLSRFKNWNIDQIMLRNNRRIEFYLDHNLKIRRNRMIINVRKDKHFIGKMIIPETTYKLFQHIPIKFDLKELGKTCWLFRFIKLNRYFFIIKNGV